jgi:hypothetical protein
MEATGVCLSIIRQPYVEHVHARAKSITSYPDRHMSAHLKGGLNNLTGTIVFKKNLLAIGVSWNDITMPNIPKVQNKSDGS